MRKSGIVLVLIALFAAVWGTSASALSSPQTFNLLDISSNDVAPINGFTFNRAPRPGDQFAIEDALYKWAGTKKGARVGRVEGIATFQSGFSAEGATILFFAQAYIPGGTVVVHGYGHVNQSGPSTFTFPVLGGTGIYSNARGYVVVRDLGDGQGNNSNVEFHLLP